MSDIDPKFKYQVAQESGGEKIKLCFACGICTASCPVREIDDRYNPRKIIRMILLGMKKRVLGNDFIWLCSGCYACTERCPQGVRFTEVMNAVKNIAVIEGYVPKAFIQQLELLKKLGRLYEIDEFDNNKRAALGLPRVSKTKGFTEKIMKFTGVDQLLAPQSIDK
ncbi:MAG: 4Fe-4S dicluster domain-containing protein [candidate division WOR-3 bacterium]